MKELVNLFQGVTSIDEPKKSSYLSSNHPTICTANQSSVTIDFKETLANTLARISCTTYILCMHTFCSKYVWFSYDVNMCCTTSTL